MTSTSFVCPFFNHDHKDDTFDLKVRGVIFDVKPNKDLKLVINSSDVHYGRKRAQAKFRNAKNCDHGEIAVYVKWATDQNGRNKLKEEAKVLAKMKHGLKLWGDVIPKFYGMYDVHSSNRKRVCAISVFEDCMDMNKLNVLLQQGSNFR